MGEERHSESTKLCFKLPCTMCKIMDLHFTLVHEEACSASPRCRLLLCNWRRKQLLVCWTKSLPFNVFSFDKKISFSISLKPHSTHGKSFCRLDILLTKLQHA